MRTYFAEARIRGIDISRARIAICRRRLAQHGDRKTSFVQAGSAAREEAETYDAIFAMAVFRHGDLSTRPPRCGHRIRFSSFDREIGELARCLKPGGFLAIQHAHFRFADTRAAAGFELVLDVDSNPAVPVYGPDNRLAPQTAREGVLFRKLPPADRNLTGRSTD